MFEPLKPRIIRGSRRKYFLNMLLSIAFVCAGILMVRIPVADPESFSAFKQIGGGWLAIIVFGYYSLIFIRILFRPHILVLDGTGFTLDGGRVRVPGKIAWRDVQGFYVRKQRRAQFIGYRLQAQAGAGKLQMPAERILPHVWPLSIEDMVDLLDNYRLQALDRAKVTGLG